MSEQEFDMPTQVATKKETDQKCPECGGVIDFNPSTGMLKCPYCDYESKIEVKDEHFVAEELDFDTAEDHASCDWGMAVKSVECKSCGAETVYDANQVAHECPYCGSNQVMEVAGDNIMAPSGVVLFTVSDAEAGKKFTDWIGGKWFTPSSAKKKAKPESFQGVYLPFWSFDTNTESRYSAEYGIVTEYTDDDGKTSEDVDWYHTSGRYDKFFDDYIMCASKNQNEAMLKGLKPYNTNDVKEYLPQYMAGFSAERYSRGLKETWPLAQKEMEHIIEDNIEERIKKDNDADRVRSLTFNTDYFGTKYKYLLLPVWMSSFKHNGKIYHFMVNGQTGKVNGDAPISWIRVTLAVLLGILLLGLMLYLNE